MSRIPNTRDVRYRRAQAAQQAADASVVARVVTLEEGGTGGTLPDITGPAILGRESGTGKPVAITLGPGFSIVGGVLIYNPPATSSDDYLLITDTATTLLDYDLITATVTTSEDYGGMTVSP